MLTLDPRSFDRLLVRRRRRPSQVKRVSAKGGSNFLRRRLSIQIWVAIVVRSFPIAKSQCSARTLTGEKLVYNQWLYVCIMAGGVGWFIRAKQGLFLYYLAKEKEKWTICKKALKEFLSFGASWLAESAHLVIITPSLLPPLLLTWCP